MGPTLIGLPEQNRCLGVICLRKQKSVYSVDCFSFSSRLGAAFGIIKVALLFVYVAVKSNSVLQFAIGLSVLVEFFFFLLSIFFFTLFIVLMIKGDEFEVKFKVCFVVER